MTKKRAAIVSDIWTPERPALLERIFGPAERERIEASFSLAPGIVSRKADDRFLESLDGVQVLFGSWDFLQLTAKEIASLDKLEHIFYAAGSVKYFGRPFLEAGIPISTAKKANGRAVVSFVVAQALLASKGYFQSILSSRTRHGYRAAVSRNNDLPGVLGGRVALIGFGVIARGVAAELTRYGMKVGAYDPFAGSDEMATCGVEKIERLQEAFSDYHIVSNHLPNLPQLNGLIGKELFFLMKDNASFINTGRGAQVDEQALVDALVEKPSLVALLDVTFPEPPDEDSPLYTLDNCFLSSHIAGSLGGELSRMSAEVIESSEGWLAGEPLDNLESLESLEVSA